MTNKTQPYPSNAENQLQLEDLEHLVYSRQLTQAANLLIKILQRIEHQGAGLVPDPKARPQERDHQQLQLLTRFASCITALLADSQFNLPHKSWSIFMSFKRYITAVFIASGFGDTNHLIPLAGERDNQGKSIITNDYMLRKLLLAVSPSAPAHNLDYANWLETLPKEMSVPFWVSFVDPDFVLGKEEAHNRQQVALMHNKLPTDHPEMSDTLLTRLVNAWMFTSYMDFAEKHQPKKTLNKIIKSWAQAQGVKEPNLKTTPKQVDGKPTLVIASERFTSPHAMHRSYRPAIDSLKKHFYTVCLCIDESIDDEARKAFDEVHTFERSEPIKTTAERLVKIRPQAIYYPSLGMQNWTVALAQFRFAPIQFMTLGHPATSMSPVIDYAFTGEANPDLFSEKIVRSRHYEKFQHVPHPSKQDFTRQRQDTERVRIAVNAKHYKINYRLIEACQSIEKHSSKPVEFIFFPSCSGINYEAFRRELNRYLKATVYPRTGYELFIDRLRTCDMVLNPFPFGNSSGINDCARIGLPFVCMDGEEPHSHVDALLSERLGYPAFLRTQNQKEYINAALRLVNDDELREGIIKDTVDSRAADRITGPEAGPSQFGEAVAKLYGLHDQLKESSERIVDLDNLSVTEPATQP